MIGWLSLLAARVSARAFIEHDRSLPQEDLFLKLAGILFSGVWLLGVVFFQLDTFAYTGWRF
jgi:hypothetical protein